MLSPLLFPACRLPSWLCGLWSKTAGYGQGASLDRPSPLKGGAHFLRETSQKVVSGYRRGKPGQKRGHDRSWTGPAEVWLMWSRCVWVCIHTCTHKYVCHYFSSYIITAYKIILVRGFGKYGKNPKQINTNIHNFTIQSLQNIAMFPSTCLCITTYMLHI